MRLPVNGVVWLVLDVLKTAGTFSLTNIGFSSIFDRLIQAQVDKSNTRCVYDDFEFVRACGT